MSTTSGKKVLLVKMSSLGDVVHALPAVSDAVLHGVQVDWVVEEAFADIPSAHPGVNRVYAIAWRRWRRDLRAAGAEMREFFDALRGQSYDLIIDSQGLIKSAVVALMARGKRTGFSFTTAREPWAAFAYGRGHKVARGQHAIDRQRQLFGAVLGYEPDDMAVSGLEVTGPRSQRVVLLHGTTWPSKHWPVAMWQQLARQVRADGFEPMVTWGNAEERARAEEIATPGDAVVMDRAPLQELAQVLGHAAAVIGVDSGLCHYSAALGTPTVGLYGPTSGQLTGCRGVAAGFLQAATDCSPCLSRQCRAYRGEPLAWDGRRIEPPCFATLAPAKVWQYARELMHTPRLQVQAD
jgi:heptosyltransferase-1